MKSASQRIELAANVLIVIAALLLIGVIVQRYFIGSPQKAEQSARMQPTLGKKVNLGDTDFSQTAKTVVLALQTNCGYCNQSAPFYKRLVEQTKNKNIKFVAVFPTLAADGNRHLSELGINGFEVRQAPISDLDAGGTPTLIITNDKGEVTDFWVGKLPAEKEAEVLDKLNS